MEIKIKQIIPAPNGIFVFCDDDTIWNYDYIINEWSKLPPIPGTNTAQQINS